MNRSELSHHIESFRSQGGEIRRFDRGDCGDYDALILFLQRRGYRLTKKNGLYIIASSSVRNPRRRTWNDVIAFVDDIRAKEGKQRIRRALA